MSNPGPWKLAVVMALGAVWASGCVPDGDRKVLRVANWGGAGDDSAVMVAYREVFEEFERQHPGVEIQVEGTPGSQDYVNKMLLSFVAKSAPDVITLDASSSGVFVDNGLMRDLTPFIAQDKQFSIDAYFPNVLDIYRRGGKQYGVPLDFTPMVVYANRRLFREAGVPVPKPDWTVDDFRRTARQLTKGNKYGFNFTTWMPGWIMWVWNNGGDVLSADGGQASGHLDGPESTAALQMLADMVLVDKSAPALSQAAAAGVDPFANGDCAMEVSGHWALTSFAESEHLDLDDIVVLPMPRAAGKPSKTVVYAAAMGVSRDAKDPGLAWEFVKYMTSAPVQRKIQASRVAVCARKDVARELAKDDREKAFLAITATARPPWGSRVRGYDFVETEGAKLMDGVLKNGLDLRQGARQAAGEIDRYLAKQ